MMLRRTVLRSAFFSRFSVLENKTCGSKLLTKSKIAQSFWSIKSFASGCGTMTTDDTFLYFAYGSNLSETRIHINNPSAQFCSIAKLQDYRLVFGRKENWMSSRWHGGVASIEETSGEHVWGVVWKIHWSDRPNLDRQEGTYRVIYVDVQTPDGKLLTCRTYQMEDVIEIPTSPQYLNVITTGASIAGLPQDYIQFLSKVEHNDYKGSLQVMSKMGDKFLQEQEDTKSIR